MGWEPPIHQSTNPPIHQSTNPPIHQSTNPPIHQSTNPPIHQSTNPGIHPESSLCAISSHFKLVKKNKTVPPSRRICPPTLWSAAASEARRRFGLRACLEMDTAQIQAKAASPFA